MAFNETSIASAGDTVAVIDALLRFGAGVDHDDPALLATAFSDGAVVDFSPCGRTMGLGVPVADRC